MITIVRLEIEHPDDVDAWPCVHEVVGIDPTSRLWAVQTEFSSDRSYRVRPFRVLRAFIVSSDQEAST